MLEYPKKNSRQWAMLQYMAEYAQANQGRPPAMRDFIRDKVGADTSMGPLTSTSVVNYNLKRLVDLGYVREIEGDDFIYRRYVLRNGVYGVPDNVANRRPISDYYFVVLDDTAGIWNPCNAAVIVLAEFIGRVAGHIVTASEKHGPTVPDIWEHLDPDINKIHLPPSPAHRPTWVLEKILEGSITKRPNIIAVVTDDHKLALAATGFGSGVFPVPVPEI